jgi:IS5 family transposase
MGPKDKHKLTRVIFQQPLEEIINLYHPLVGLSKLIDWPVFEREWLGFSLSKTGRPAMLTRLVAGLLYLQHTFAMSDQ